MIHIYEPGSMPVTFVLLHGTGGDEHDLISLAKMIMPEAAILSLRGNIVESGMYRFFKRHAPGILDEDSVIEETHNVMSFLKEAEFTYNFSLKQSIALGYSNGANLLASLLFHYGDVFQGVLMHHPMMPLKNPTVMSQPSNVWIGAGSNDPIVPKEQTISLELALKNAGATVSTSWFQQGHQITQEEVQVAKERVKQWQNS